jgi:hypothetical protein
MQLEGLKMIQNFGTSFVDDPLSELRGMTVLHVLKNNN